MKEKNKPVGKKSVSKLIFVMALCIMAAGIYFAVLSAEEHEGMSTSIVMQVYAYADGTLILAFLILNGGLSSGVPTLDMIDKSVPREKAEKFIEGIVTRKKYSKPLLYAIIPLTFTLFADFMLLFWGDTVRNALSAVLK